MGTQIDLRDDAATIDKLAKNKQKPISIEQGDKLQKELRAVKYVECSALTQVRIGKDSKSHFEKELYLSSQIKAFSGTKYGVHVPILILQGVSWQSVQKEWLLTGKTKNHTLNIKCKKT